MVVLLRIINSLNYMEGDANKITSKMIIIRGFSIKHKFWVHKRNVSTFLICTQNMLSHVVASESDIRPCIKTDKLLVIYRFTGNVMTSIIMLRKIRENLKVFTPKMQFFSV